MTYEQTRQTALAIQQLLLLYELDHPDELHSDAYRDGICALRWLNERLDDADVVNLRDNYPTIVCPDAENVRANSKEVLK